MPKNEKSRYVEFEKMPPFIIVSDFWPTGYQPQAVDRLFQGLERICIADEMETEE